MNPPADWTQSFFSGMMLAAQRSIPQQTAAEADFLVRHLATKAGASILDVPCGTGRLSIALAERGFAVTGCDGAEELLIDGRAAARERNLSATFDRRDMRDLPGPAQFDHAFCLGNSFAYFDDEGNAAFLKSVHRALKFGGRFVLETHLCMESVILTRLQRAWFPLGDLFFLVDTAYDPPAATLTSSYIVIHNNGEVERKQAVYRLYTYRELMNLLRDCGFTVRQTFGSLEGASYSLGATGLWVVAEKPEPAAQQGRT